MQHHLGLKLMFCASLKPETIKNTLKENSAPLYTSLVYRRKMHFSSSKENKLSYLSCHNPNHGPNYKKNKTDTKRNHSNNLKILYCNLI